MQTHLLQYFRRSVHSRIVKICMPMASLLLTTSAWAGYSPPPEQDSPKDPTGSTSLIEEMTILH